MLGSLFTVVLSLVRCHYIVNMVFVLDNFVAKPELNSLNECKKADLLAIANHYGITAAPSLRKAELRAAVIHGLCALGVISTLSVDNVGESNTLMSAGEGPSDVLQVDGPSTLKDMEATGLGRGDATPQVQVGSREDKLPHTLPLFDPASTESSASSRLNVRLK